MEQAAIPTRTRPRTRAKARRASSESRRAPEKLWEVRVRDIWGFVWTQPASFWLINLYLLFEYVRPQSVYPAIDVLPWAQMAVLGALAALALEGKFPKVRHALSKWYLGFIAVLLISALTAWRPSLAWENISLPLSWFLIYLLIVNTINTERRFLVFVLAFLLYSLKMSQHGARSWASIGFGFRDWGATGGPGWFHNSGEFGIQMCIFFPLALYFIIALRPYWPRWKLWLFALMPITAVMSMIASSSRGALVGGALVLGWIVVRSRYRIRASVAAAVAGLLVFVFIPEGQMQRLETMGEDDTSVHRLTMWEDGIEIANDFPAFGIGYDNWIEYYDRFYDRGLPHNIFIEAWAELGYFGLFFFLALLFGTFLTNRRSRRIASKLGEEGRFLYYMGWGLDGALVGYIGSGFFVTVLHYPYFWINLAMTVCLRVAVRRKARETGRARQARPRRVAEPPASTPRASGRELVAPETIAVER